MTEDNPIDLFFSGMQKLGPGDDQCTLAVLNKLPIRNFKLVVDAGCGTGRQTLVLAKALNITIHAVDNHRQFLAELTKRSHRVQTDKIVKTHCMDMADIPKTFENIDLLWSEGAAYNMGFGNALKCWAQAMSPQGLVVVSELTWLTAHPPEHVSHFFTAAYPDMASQQANATQAEKAGYHVLDTQVLPRKAWLEEYYDVLAPKAAALAQHENDSVRAFALETQKEIEIFENSGNSYGYVFYILQRA